MREPGEPETAGGTETWCGPEATAGPRAAACIERWREFPHSRLSHHGAPCCDIAREWVLAFDFSQLGGSSPATGPRWLRQRYTWGPSPWPLHWCEAAGRKTLDCGALASLAHELFRARGVGSFPAQLIQQYTQDATRHWRRRWADEDCSPHWIDGELIYHEGCAVLAGTDEIELWDASAACWLSPTHLAGYASLLALRVFAPAADAPAAFRWGAHLIAPNRWHELEPARA